MTCRIKQFTTVLSLVMVLAGQAEGEITFIGPFLYRSAADSPFDLSGLGSTFFLEDFEDSDFDETPGIAGSYLGQSFGFSVDGDDGAIDGVSNGGASAHPQFISNSTTTADSALEVYFNTLAFGSFPTAFGMVITGKDNSAAIMDARISVYDYSGNTLASLDLTSLSSNSFDATDDLFIGVMSSEGLPIVAYSEIVQIIPAIPRLTRVDHLQYGLFVPEPTNLTLFLVACSLSMIRKRAGLNWGIE